MTDETATIETATIETATIDPATAERLARLQARRDRPASKPASQAQPAPSVAPASRRRSPASGAKIITAGATATATLGLLALYGAAEQRSANAAAEIEPVPADTVAAVGGAPAASAVVPPASPASPPAPQIVVVVVDGRSGAATVETAAPGTSLTDAIEQATAIDQSTAFDPSIASAQPATIVPTDTATVATPLPAPVPAVVELAVPAPPRPAPTAAPTAAPAPAPAPQASSDGS